MKKIFLFICLSTLSLVFNSCSDDDSKSSNSGGKVTFKIDGVSKTLGTTTVTADAPDSDGDVYLNVSATDGGTNNFTFYVYRGRLGNDGYANFYINGNLYETYNFTIYFTQNDEHRLKGTFSGQVYTQNADMSTITDGAFDIKY